MIERLNFYDVYGYLIPGLVLVTLIWLPYGLTDGALVSIDWSSALLALVFSYIAGHLIQGLARVALPSTRKDKNGESRYPSDILLDDGGESLSPEVKSCLVRRIQDQFGIDVTNARNEDPEIRRRHRLDAFMLCRRVLIQKGVASYAEQFEGMYALMRGVTTATIFGVSYYIGLLIRSQVGFMDTTIKAWFLPAAVIDMFVILILAISSLNLKAPGRKQLVQRWLFWLITALLFLLAVLVAPDKAHWVNSPSTLFYICFTLAFVSLRSYGAYHEFSRRFAETVYRDFCAL